MIFAIYLISNNGPLSLSFSLARAIVRVRRLFRSVQYTGLHKDQTPCFTSENLVEKNGALREALKTNLLLWSSWSVNDPSIDSLSGLPPVVSPGLCKVPSGGGPRRKCVINQRILLNVRRDGCTFYDLTTVAHKERCHFLARRSFKILRTILGYMHITVLVACEKNKNWDWEKNKR